MSISIGECCEFGELCGKAWELGLINNGVTRSLAFAIV